MINKAILVGRITKDIELKSTTSGKEVCQFILAVTRNYKTNDKYESDFITCKAFGKTAEFISKFTKKGNKLAIEGRILTGSYEKDGNKVYTTDIIVENVSFVETKKKEEKPVETKMEETDPYQLFGETIEHKTTLTTEEIDNIDMQLPF